MKIFWYTLSNFSGPNSTELEVKALCPETILLSLKIAVNTLNMRENK